MMPCLPRFSASDEGSISHDIACDPSAITQIDLTHEAKAKNVDVHCADAPG